MEPQCTLLLPADPAVFKDDRMSRRFDWASLSIDTNFIPFLVEEIVHQAPPEEQFGRLMGLTRWLLLQGAPTVLFNVARPAPGKLPSHAVLLWGSDWPNKKNQISTLGIPLDATLELWNLDDRREWVRMIQPERAHYGLPLSMAPGNMSELLYNAFKKWIKAIDAPVVFINCKAPDQKGKVRMHCLDVSNWVSNLSPDGLRLLMDRGGKRGEYRPFVLEIVDRNAALDLNPSTLEASFASPSDTLIATREAIRQANLLQASAPQVRKSVSRRL